MWAVRRLAVRASAAAATAVALQLQLGVTADADAAAATTFAEEVDQRHAQLATDRSMSRLIFMGTGSSSGTPIGFCLTEDGRDDHRCRVARQALEGPAHLNKNHRLNPSVLIHHVVARDSTDPDLVGGDGATVDQLVQIDVGKTFREGIVRWFPRRAIPRPPDAFILTHGHADAMLGLDDLRGFQMSRDAPTIPIWLAAECLEVVQTVFAYLVPKPPQPGEVDRKVAKLEWRLMEHFSPFVMGRTRLRVLPFPVWHGSDLQSMGFVFGSGPRKVVYISDVSEIGTEAMAMLADLSARGELDVLVVDCLFEDLPHPTHFDLVKAVDTVRRLRPRRAFLVGMSGLLEHDDVNERLARLREAEGLDVMLAYDGLCIDVAL